MATATLSPPAPSPTKPMSAAKAAAALETISHPKTRSAGRAIKTYFRAKKECDYKTLFSIWDSLKGVHGGRHSQLNKFLTLARQQLLDDLIDVALESISSTKEVSIQEIKDHVEQLLVMRPENSTSNQRRLEVVDKLICVVVDALVWTVTDAKKAFTQARTTTGLARTSCIERGKELKRMTHEFAFMDSVILVRIDGWIIRGILPQDLEDHFPAPHQELCKAILKEKDRPSIAFLKMIQAPIYLSR